MGRGVRWRQPAEGRGSGEGRDRRAGPGPGAGPAVGVTCKGVPRAVRSWDLAFCFFLFIEAGSYVLKAGEQR